MLIVYVPSTIVIIGFQKIDFDALEELFKIGVNPVQQGPSTPAMASSSCENSMASSVHSKKQQDTLLDHKRLRNVAITRRKLASLSQTTGMSIAAVVRTAVHW